MNKIQNSKLISSPTQNHFSDAILTYYTITHQIILNYAFVGRMVYSDFAARQQSK